MFCLYVKVLEPPRTSLVDCLERRRQPVPDCLGHPLPAPQTPLDLETLASDFVLVVLFFL